MSRFPDFDLYSTLHLSKDASAEDVRKHYVRIIRRNHIDHPNFLNRIRSQYPVQQDEGQAEYQDRIAEIAKRSVQRFNVAYEILSNPEERKAYDRHIGATPPPEEAPSPSDLAVKRFEQASQDAPDQDSRHRHFFNRYSESTKGSRRRRTESESGSDKYSFWKR